MSKAPCKRMLILSFQQQCNDKQTPTAHLVRISIYLTLRQLETGKVDTAFIALSTKCCVFGLFSEQHYNIDNNESAYERQEILHAYEAPKFKRSIRQKHIRLLFQRLVSRENEMV